MIYPKSILTGIVFAITGAILWLLATLVLPIFVLYLLFKAFPSGVSESGGIGATAAFVDSDSILAAALVSFAIGCYWTFRGGLRRRPSGRSGPPIT